MHKGISFSPSKLADTWFSLVRKDQEFTLQIKNLKSNLVTTAVRQWWSEMSTV